jgi:hypothetical protein
VGCGTGSVASSKSTAEGASTSTSSGGGGARGGALLVEPPALLQLLVQLALAGVLQDQVHLLLRPRTGRVAGMSLGSELQWMGGAARGCAQAAADNRRRRRRRTLS